MAAIKICPKHLYEILAAGEDYVWGCNYWNDGKRKSDDLYFTSHRMIWSVKKRSVFRRTITFEDLPYKAIRHFDRDEFSRAKQVLWGRSGELLVQSVAGNFVFPIVASRDDNLKNCILLLRYFIVGEAGEVSK